MLLLLLVLQEYTAVYVASQRLEELLEMLSNDGDTRPLVITSRDRLDILMGLLASQVGGTVWYVVLHQVTILLLLHCGPSNLSATSASPH